MPAELSVAVVDCGGRQAERGILPHLLRWRNAVLHRVFTLLAGDDGAEGVTARHAIAYAILLAAIALVAAWRLWTGRARHRHRARDDRIDLFRDD